MGIFSFSFLKRFIYLILVTGLTFFLYYRFPASEGYWCIWTALLFSQITFGVTFLQRLFHLIFLALLATLIVFAAGMMTSVVAFTFLYLFLITFSCALISQKYPTYFLSAFIVNLLAILAMQHSLPFTENVTRGAYVLVGATISIICQIIFWPRFMRNEWRSHINMTLQNMTSLTDDIFACLLEPDYPENIYLYERRIHLQKDAFLRNLIKLKHFIHQSSTLPPVEKTRLTSVAARLDHLFDIILDAAQLRRRITDYATLEVCKRELDTINHEINKIYSHLIAATKARDYKIDTLPLQHAIIRLDESYQSIIQVTAREPLAFFLFIASMKAFLEEIEGFHGLPQII